MHLHVLMLECFVLFLCRTVGWDTSPHSSVSLRSSMQSAQFQSAISRVHRALWTLCLTMTRKSVLRYVQYIHTYSTLITSFVCVSTHNSYFAYNETCLNDLMATCEGGPPVYRDHCGLSVNHFSNTVRNNVAIETT